MTLLNTVIKFYFNHVYNPVYDKTTAQLTSYQFLQAQCVHSLAVSEHSHILCVGLGTGNELYHLKNAADDIRITGIDYSKNAIKKAAVKGAELGIPVDLHIMDAGRLSFRDELFDAVCCVHVMDFVPDISLVTGEIVRVLKTGGRFVITYPSKMETLGLGTQILRGNNESNQVRAPEKRPATVKAVKMMAILLIGLLYLPLLFRPQKKQMSRDDVAGIFENCRISDYTITEISSYGDFIVSGEK